MKQLLVSLALVGCTANINGIRCDSREDCPAQVACLPDQSCDPVPSIIGLEGGSVLINELYYDSPGVDTGTFIELKGPPGTPLSGFQLQASKGDGSVYTTINLSGQIPSSGYVVVAQDSAVPNATIIDSHANLQNTSGSLLLLQDGAIIDALSYGAPSVIKGEGESATTAGSSATEGLARFPDGADTGNNAANFKAQALTPGVSNGGDPSPTQIKTVFVILMENHNWSQIKGSPSAPYINNTLLPIASHAEQYRNVPGLHPSEPNYLWLEAGQNFGIKDDKNPSSNHQSTSLHLTNQLEQAGISWRSYQEGIDGVSCPLTRKGLYAPKHNPMVYFDDVTDHNNPNSPKCIEHIRPFAEFLSDLETNNVARYNFITPDLCNDMHDSSGCASSNSVINGDTWLSIEVPKILASAAYQDGGALFITWDESEGGDLPIGLIALSPLAKGSGYTNNITYSHSSLLRTIQTIFNVGPFLGDAANATDLSDLFHSF